MTGWWAVAVLGAVLIMLGTLIVTDMRHGRW